MFLNVSYASDPSRAAVFNTKLHDEYNLGHVKEAVSLVRMDLTEDWVLDFTRRYPWVLLPSVKFTRCDEIDKNGAAGSKRKRRRKTDGEADGYQYALVYLGKRKMEFYRHFERIGLVPGLNATSWHHPGPIGAGGDTPAASSPAYLAAAGSVATGSHGSGDVGSDGGISFAKHGRTNSLSLGMVQHPAPATPMEQLLRRVKTDMDSPALEPTMADRQYRQDLELLDQLTGGQRHKRQTSTGEQLAFARQAQAVVAAAAAAAGITDPQAMSAGVVAAVMPSMPMGMQGIVQQVNGLQNGSSAQHMDTTQFFSAEQIQANQFMAAMNAAADQQAAADGFARELHQLAQGIAPANNQLSPQMTDLLLQQIQMHQMEAQQQQQQQQQQAAASTSPPAGQTSVAPAMISPPPDDPFAGAGAPNMDYTAMQGTEFDLIHNVHGETLNSP